ncbi:cytosolic sulfotransferase 5-like [Gossypium arboreum]|uniref:cytosolic sulfotransferase 5-like n=1 Tax=Gossypium arboreum TaxID=29729 RepID=UPI00081974A1|nr:cytosolic sulfotransferase 5-like [Gossypium arboreum]
MEHSSFPSAFSTLFGELPKETWCCSDLYKWEGFWYTSSHLPAAMAARLNFQANDSDVFLTSSMKTGTTWLKAIIPTIMNPIGRMDDDNNDPLLKRHPNELMPSLEVQLFKENPNPDLSYMSSPRLFRTHIPYPMLPESVKNSACKIVYITRDPKDTFGSLWHFFNSLVTTHGIDPWPMNEAFDSFCRGVHVFGPFHDHVLSYWKESIKRPEKILFLRYEDMRKDPKGQLRRLACFLGRPFEKEKEVDKVLWRCSLERLKNLEVNQHGADPWLGFEYKFYFRRGSVGDWKNNMSNEMKEKLDHITAMKYEGSDLGFGH